MSTDSNSTGSGNPFAKKGTGNVYAAAATPSTLSPAEAERLLYEPVKWDYTYSPAALRCIFQAAGGQPELLRLLGELLYARWQEQGGTTIKAADYYAVQSLALEQSASVHRNCWRDLRPAEKAVVAALAALVSGAGEAVPTADLDEQLASTGLELPVAVRDKALHNLLANGILQTAGSDAYRFSADLFRRWVEANFQPPAPPEPEPASEPVPESASEPVRASEPEPVPESEPEPVAPQVEQPSRSAGAWLPKLAILLLGVVIVVSLFSLTRNWVLPTYFPPLTPTITATVTPTATPSAQPYRDQHPDGDLHRDYYSHGHADAQSYDQPDRHLGGCGHR